MRGEGGDRGEVNGEKQKYVIFSTIKNFFFFLKKELRPPPLLQSGGLSVHSPQRGCPLLGDKREFPVTNKAMRRPYFKTMDEKPVFMSYLMPKPSRCLRALMKSGHSVCFLTQNYPNNTVNLNDSPSINSSHYPLWKPCVCNELDHCQAVPLLV